jgi:DNA-binding transcriptional MerR regulator
MTHNRDPLWTIEELGTQVVLALSDNYAGQSNGSVRDVPDRRTIRYYTTLGLIDRPAEMRGRTAVYSRRHLLQLVAIKRLQSRGLTLAEVQQKLLGITDRELQNLAALPAGFAEPAAQPADATEPNGRRESFWREAPAPPENHRDAGAAQAGNPQLVQGIRVHEALTLLLETARPLEEDDIEALRIVAEPLLKLLEKRRLLRPDPERRTS